MAMEDLGGEMGNLSEETEDSVTDQTQKDTKTKIDNTKPEDLDGLQMLRLPQEDDKSLLRKDILSVVSDESIDHPTLFEEPVSDEVKCIQIAKPVIREDDSPLKEPKADIVTEEAEKEDLKPIIEQDEAIRRIALKHKGVDGAAVKPALVKKEVSEIHDRLTERQQKILQDIHVKFVLEGVNVEEDDESRARKHSEFVELKKRLEEEEKMYAGCALGEASDITDGSDTKDQIEQGETIGDSNDGDKLGDKDVDPSTTCMARNLAATLHAVNEDIDSSDVAVRATIDGVINSLAEVAICRPRASSPEVDRKPQLGPQNVRNAMKGLADDDDGLSELQEYTNREGSVECQVWLLL